MEDKISKRKLSKINNITSELTVKELADNIFITTSTTLYSTSQSKEIYEKKETSTTCNTFKKYTTARHTKVT